MSEISSNDEQEGKQLLASIFKVIENNYSSFLNDSSNIPNLLLFLKDKKNNMIVKAEIIFTLLHLFQTNGLLLSLFMKKHISSIINIYEPLIDLYLIKDEYLNKYGEYFEKFIIMIRNNITLTKIPIEYIFQKLSFYFENKESEENEEKEEKEILDENQILKYLNLLKIFYTGGTKENNIFEKNNIPLDVNNINNQNIKEIKNYIYFNGLRSSVSLELNNNRINQSADYPILKYGLSFIMWVYIDSNLIKKYQEINNNIEIKLVAINISGEQIKLVFKDIYTLQVSLNDSEINNIQTNLIKVDDWNNICFSITEKKDSMLQCKIFINSRVNTTFLKVPNNFSISSRINNIKLFENFIGKVSSFMFVTKELDTKEVNYFSNVKQYGFYKNKILFDFILSNEKNYFSNCKNYKYYQKYKSDKLISFYDFHSSKQSSKNMMGIFCPFSYNNEKNQIDDIFGNFIGVLGENDGVNYFENNSKTIRQLGGIQNLLPIIELMYSTISKSKKSKYNFIDKSILTQKTFYEYLNLIKNIIIGKSQNLFNANKSKFFSSLSIFIEKFPPDLFNSNILEILLDIGKEAFCNADKFNSSSENYITLILLNEKIVNKYNPENQIILWKNIYSFFTSDDTQIKECFNIRKICLLLRLFDQNRYNKYCCKNHAEVFQNNNNEENNNFDLEIMQPEMHEIIDDLFKILQIYVDKFCYEKQTINLFQLLSLDLSPCLQKKIFQIYFNYFDNKKIDLNIKLKSFDILIKNGFIEIIEYVYSISLLDIRFEILSFFKIIFETKVLKQKFQNYMGKGDNDIIHFYIFIGDYLLPEHLYVEINENNNIIEEEGENKEGLLLPLTNYFNKNIYEKETKKIWNFLNKWLVYKVPSHSNIGNKKVKESIRIHNFIIDFCISFVSKSPFNYIDLFILSLISFFKDEKIHNRDIFYINKNLYPWLIETIFYFHNSEISNYIFRKEDIISIQKNSIDLFEEFFVHRRPHDEVDKRIYYLIKYSIHLRKINGNTNNKKILEITRITRLLLQKIMDVSSLHMNFKSKICFYFMIFHKDLIQINGIKRNITFSRKNYLRLNSAVDSSRKNTDFINKNLKNKNEKNNNSIILKTINEKDKDKNNDDFKKKKSINLNFTLNLDKIELYNDNLFKNKSDIIPSYIFNNLHCDEFINNNLGKNGESNKAENLKIIWDDFILYDTIIDYYSSNIWGIENLRKKVKVDIETDIIILYKNLIKEYGENKTYRNILIKDVLKCFNIKYSEENTIAEKVKINILNINVILLCIALDLCQDYDESIFIEGKFLQFIIFCIMASININSNGIYYSLIQDNLYDALGFAFIFLKNKDIGKYRQIVDNLITPIIRTDDVKKFKFFKNKKFNNKNSAINRLFELREKKRGDSEEMNEYSNSGLATERKTTKFNYKKYDRDIFPKSNIYKDDSNINTKKNINLRVFFKGDDDLILKHLFEDTLEKIKEEKKYHFGFKTNYKNVYNSEMYYTGNSPKDEKLRINKKIKKVITLYENLNKNYANDEYLIDKEKRNNYKLNKSKLFSWRGFWSNKYLFYEHPELLKLKTKNHYTKEMVKPLLVPILDIDYYTPPFKKFDKKKLFNDNNYNYKINLDIDDILLDELENENNQNDNSINENIIIDQEGENENLKITKNKYGFNFLECLYKSSYNDLWEKYKEYSKQDINFDKLIHLYKEPYSTLINSKIMSSNIENIQRENIYNCCIVKLTHHIKGYISTEKSKIRFIFASNSDIKEEDLENDIYYDKEMGCCFGSVFKYMENDKDKVIISIDYINIKYIFTRQYFYNESALEIFTDFNKSYFFNFKTNKDLMQFKSDILHHGIYRKIKAQDFKGKKIIGYQQINPDSKNKSYYVSNKMEEWQNNNISTMEYLMWLNIYSGRSFNDLTQYPVFPWLITNYSDESQEITIKNDLRNLSLPIGMFDSNEKEILRKNAYIEIYESTKNELNDMFPDFNYQDYLKKGDEYLENYKNKKIKKEKDNSEEIALIEFNQIPYFYGSHYSNPTYVSHFLIRLFPFAYIGIEIQGKSFDTPERMFTSMNKTFESTSTLNDDVRELIPEFYMLSELFLNRNNINLAQNKLDAENNLIIINDVKLPLWSNNNPINFVVKLRSYLESNYTNNNINKWIDLIFGVTQRGGKAEENHNIYQAHTYDNNVKIESIEDIITRNCLMRQYEMGVTPFQIFESESKNKNNQKFTLDNFKKLKYKIIKSNQNEIYKKENIKIEKISFIENEKIKIFTNKNQWHIIKMEESEINNNNINISKIDESNISIYKNNSSKYACSYKISNIETPIIIFNNSENVIKGGFWDGRLELNILNSDIKEDQSNQIQTIFNPFYSPIITMEISKDEKLLLCGTKKGILMSYNINKNNNIEFKKGLYLFDDEITSISINDTLNMFGVSSKDGFINLHILPSHKLVRTIYLNKNKNDNIKTLLYADNIFLSSSPLACIVLYIKSKSLFMSFTINGELICEINESEDNSIIKSSLIYMNNHFQDILIYGTNKGFIKIRKFPEMTLINSIEVFPNKEINSICLSHDKKYCFACSSDNIIAVIKEKSDI